MQKNKYKISLPLISTGKRSAFFIALRTRYDLKTIKRIISILNKFNVNIISGIHSTNREGRYVDWLFLADFNNSKHHVEEIIKKISSLKNVICIDYGIKWFDDMGFPSFPLELTFMRGNVTIWRKSWIALLLRAILYEFKEGGQAFLYYVGKRTGHVMAKELSERFGIHSIRGLLELELELWKILGWIDDYEICEVQRTPPRVLVRVYGLFTCEPFKNSETKPMGHFARGMLTGCVEEMLFIALDSREDKCIIMGDPYCEFVVYSKE